MLIKPKVQAALVEIFKCVADACDGSFDKADIDMIRMEYLRQMRKPEVSDFYGNLVDERHAEAFGE